MMNSNTGITLVDVRAEAMDAIQKLKSKQMDVQTAREIKGMLEVIVNVAKTQIEFIRVIPEAVKKNMTETDVKAIAGTLQDRDAELDKSLKEIEDNRNKPYS